MEQYMDFLRNRMLRQTLICHAHIQSRYRIGADQLFPFHVASPIHFPKDVVDLASDAPLHFKAPEDLTMTTCSPLVRLAKAALLLA
jgi:methyltransferase-like protein